jgi:long-chain acyl-CoA synthetase
MSEARYPDLAAHDTLPKVLAYNAVNWPNEVALREKELGIWKAYSWKDYEARVRSFAHGFKELGVGRGDVVAIVGDNRPDWVAAEIAAHALGAASLGMYRDALDEEIRYLVEYAEARVVVAENEEQVDKLLNLEDRIPSVRHIVYCDPRGMRKYDDPRLVYAHELQERGAAADAANPSLYASWIAAVDGEELAVLCTTSGTTANPKLAMLPAGHLLRHCLAYLHSDPKGPEDEYVSVLPLPWIMEQVYVMGKALISRMTVNFVEEPETTMHDLREVGPTFLLLAPRLWEQIAADVRARIMDATPLKQRLYGYGMKAGLDAIEHGHGSPLARFLLFRALKDRFGFSRLRSAATGGAALGPDTFKFFLAMGVPLRQLYGQTELLGAYTLHEPGDIDFDSVGVPFEGVEVRIDNPDSEGVGEIVTRHPNMFSGYYKNEAETRAAFTEGWMHTGDAGYFNAKGHLVVIDRIKDLATTARGVRFSPQFIENKLKFSPYVAEAVILGAERDYLAAIICIRFSILSKWAEKNRIAFTTYSDLAARPEIYAMIRGEVETVNESLAEAQRIRKFLLLYKELDADDGELTRTRKVRRGVIADKYGEIIDTLYSDAQAVDVDTTITFQDGSRQRIRTTLEVIDLGAAGETVVPAQAAE